MEKAEKKIKEGIQVTIIERIEALMDDHKINKSRLAKEIDMGQSQLNRCLSRTGNNNISIDTLIKIADYFKVPVDHLLGRTKHGATAEPRSSAEICRILMDLIETNTVNISNGTVEEDTYQPNKGDLESYTYPYQYEKKTNTYKMIYFSNFVPLPDMKDLSEGEVDDIDENLAINGCYHPKGIEINAFIEYYLKLRDLYKNNDLPQPFFDQAIEDRLNQMRF